MWYRAAEGQAGPVILLRSLLSTWRGQSLSTSSFMYLPSPRRIESPRAGSAYRALLSTSVCPAPSRVPELSWAPCKYVLKMEMEGEAARIPGQVEGGGQGKEGGVPLD